MCIRDSATPEDVPGWLSKCRAAFFFIRASPSKMASCPTKLAEALAMGLPVLTGAGVGDVDRIVREGQVGVVLDDYSADSYRRGWRAMTTPLDDPETRARCRAVALASFSLVGAVEKDWAAYDHVVRRPHCSAEHAVPKRTSPLGRKMASPCGAAVAVP